MPEIVPIWGLETAIPARILRPAREPDSIAMRNQPGAKVVGHADER
jgi:hypothetical protein